MKTRILRRPLRPTPTGMLLVSFLTAAALSASGCGSSQEGRGSGGGKLFGPKCSAPEDSAPTFEELGEMEFPTSGLWIHSAVPTTSAAARIAEDIPQVLANEKDRDVGAPGKATYKVTRGTPTLHQAADAIEVRVPISASVSVCKDLKFTCLKYGSCSPELEARFSVANQVGKNYQWDAPKGSISATKRCVIGIDVTSEIEKIARSEVAKVQAEIAKEWPKLKPQVRGLWNEMAHPLALDDKTCVHMKPRRISYLPPQIEKTSEGDILRAAVGVTGRIVPADSCKDQELKKLPPPAIAKKPRPMSRLWFPEVLDTRAVRAALKSSVTGQWAEGENLEVLEVNLGKNEVGLRVKSSGAVCGTFWVRASWNHTQGASALKLQGAAVEQRAQAGEEAPNESVARLLKAIEERAQVPVASADWLSDHSLNPLRAALGVALPPSVELKIQKLKAGDARVTVATDGVYVLHPISARLLVTDL